MNVLRGRLRAIGEGPIAARTALTATIVALPCLFIGFLVDDYLHRLILTQTPPYGRYFPKPWFMFSFLSGDAETTQRLMDVGIYPWWATASIHISFWRPLTVLTHLVDNTLWPDWPVLMHLHSLAWYAGVCAMAALLFRRVEGRTWIAGFAALLYAIDEAHAMPVGWIANRNALIAVFFGLVCVVLHDAWRRDGRRWAAFGALLALAASVLAKESGVATTAYLFAYAVFLDRASLRVRLATLVPYAAVILAWRVYYSAQGFGAHGSPLYIDPVGEPLRFALAVAERGPALLVGQWFNAPLEVLQGLPLAARYVFGGAAAVVMAGLFAFIRKPLFGTPEARFWTTAMLLSLVPVCAVGATTRVLMFVGIGGAALIARTIDAFRENRSGLRLWCRRGLIFLHAILAPITFVATLAGIAILGRFIDRGVDQVGFPAGIEEKTAVLVDSPTYFLSLALPIKRCIEGEPVPREIYSLAPNSFVPVPIRMTRMGERTIHVSPDGGFPVLVFRSVDEPFHVGDRIELSALSVEVLEVDRNGKALTVAYDFKVPLEDPSLYWLRAKGLGYAPFQPPRLGESITLH